MIQPAVICTIAFIVGFPKQFTRELKCSVGVLADAGSKGL